MKPRDERLRLLYDVADMYYNQQKTKAEIAGILRQSATHVANLIEEAKEEGIVKIEVRVPGVGNLGLLLMSKYPHLEEVIVIPHDRDCGDLLTQLGMTAAEYFERTVKDGERISVGGGYLMYEMINRLPERDRDLHVYPAAIVGRGPTIAHIDPITLVTLLWAKSGRRKEHAHYVTVTPPANGNRTKTLAHYQEIARSKKVQELFREIEKVDHMFLSIGGIEAATEYDAVASYASQNLVLEMGMTKDALRKEGAVGDIGYSFFDANGKGRKEWTIGIALPLDNLKKMAATEGKKVVVVVGSYKIRSLEVVVKERFCNVLITDSKAAKHLLNNV